jgi:LemA protein
MSKQFKIILITLGIILVVGFMLLGTIISGYNRVITMDENVKGKWAQVENQLKINASNQLEGVLSRLLLLQERYPVLKANESFLKLQDSLEGTENRIAVERKRYNESVQILNTYIRTFMGRFYAMVAGVQSAEYYKVPEAEQAVPTVKF